MWSPSGVGFDPWSHRPSRSGARASARTAETTPSGPPEAGVRDAAQSPPSRSRLRLDGLGRPLSALFEALPLNAAAAVRTGRGAEMRGWAAELTRDASEAQRDGVTFSAFMRDLKRRVAGGEGSVLSDWLREQVLDLATFSEFTPLERIVDVLRTAEYTRAHAEPAERTAAFTDRARQLHLAEAEKTLMQHFLGQGLPPRAYIESRLSALESMQARRAGTTYGNDGEMHERFEWLHARIGRFLQIAEPHDYRPLFAELNDEIRTMQAELAGRRARFAMRAPDRPTRWGGDVLFHSPTIDGRPLHIRQPDGDATTCGYYALSAALHALGKPGVSKEYYEDALQRNRAAHLSEAESAEASTVGPSEPVKTRSADGEAATDDLVQMLRQYATRPGRRLHVRGITDPAAVLFRAYPSGPPPWVDEQRKALTDAGALLVLAHGHWTALVRNHDEHWVFIDSLNGDSQAVTYRARNGLDAARFHAQSGMRNLIALGT